MKILDYIQKRKTRSTSDDTLMAQQDKIYSDNLNKYIGDNEKIIEEGNFKKILLLNGIIVNEISNVNLRKYYKENQRLNHIIDLVSDISFLSKNSEDDDVYFKVCRDGADELVAVYFNLSHFGPGGTNVPTLFLSFGKVLSMRSRMYLEYEGYSNKLIINDFFSEVERKGHGGLMLKALLEIIPELNRRITKYNKQFYSEIEHRYSYEEFKKSLSYKKQIKLITGILEPARNLTKEDLKRFYGKYGFIKDGKLHKEV
ncbi:hypothetical protein [Paenibacillus sp. FSL H3-0333]|uniref:hypothetical protein n=1 Tax=Paenibacillus sp. FSL H3-0333 TaxID=2921373 RepID=UPI0030FC5618